MVLLGVEIPSSVLGSDGDITLFWPRPSSIDIKDRGFVGFHPFRHFVKKAPDFIGKSAVWAWTNVGQEIPAQATDFRKGS
jgi:hypothetical protein